MYLLLENVPSLATHLAPSRQAQGLDDRRIEHWVRTPEHRATKDVIVTQKYRSMSRIETLLAGSKGNTVHWQAFPEITKA
jgi:hypothetical protein